MAIRHLYVARHGAADAFGELTDVGHRQAGHLGERLAGLPVDAVWHSPLPRAATTARVLGERLPGVPVAEAAELVDHVPLVPAAADLPPALVGFFDGFDDAERASGEQLAGALVDRFAKPAETETHEVLVTHAFQVAWLLRHAMDAPPARWLGLNNGNAALTVIEYRDDRPPNVVVFNDMGHLPQDLRWTGFPPSARL